MEKSVEYAKLAGNDIFLHYCKMKGHVYDNNFDEAVEAALYIEKTDNSISNLFSIAEAAGKKTIKTHPRKEEKSTLYNSGIMCSTIIIYSGKIMIKKRSKK